MRGAARQTQTQDSRLCGVQTPATARAVLMTWAGSAHTKAQDPRDSLTPSKTEKAVHHPFQCCSRNRFT